MPFGLANAPTTFQSYIDRALQKYLDHFIIVYLDDILIYSVTLAEHEPQVTQVLEVLREHGLFTKLEKCSFCQTQVEYLGFIVSSEGLNMDPN